MDNYEYLTLAIADQLDFRIVMKRYNALNGDKIRTPFKLGM